jgi:hypothetical protein
LVLDDEGVVTTGAIDGVEELTGFEAFDLVVLRPRFETWDCLDDRIDGSAQKRTAKR